MSQAYNTASEDGALLTSTATADCRPALCGDVVMNSGQSCTEVRAVAPDVALWSDLLIGVARPTADLNTTGALTKADFWGMGSGTGKLYHRAAGHLWQGKQPYATGDVLRLLLDSDAGTLSVKKNGTLLGVMVTQGLTGDLCWTVACHAAGSSVLEF